MATAGPELEVTSSCPDESAGSGKAVTVISSGLLTSDAGDTCLRKAHYGGGLSSSNRFVGSPSSMEGTPEGHLVTSYGTNTYSMLSHGMISHGSVFHFVVFHSVVFHLAVFHLAVFHLVVFQ